MPLRSYTVLAPFPSNLTSASHKSPHVNITENALVWNKIPATNYYRYKRCQCKE
jgi:hypothetical protein